MHLFRPFVTFSLGLLAACAGTTAPDPGPGAAARPYRSSFAEAAGNRFVADLDRDQLASELQGARVLWLGDQHRSSRLHALQSELLTDLLHRGIRFTLALEAIGTQDEPAVQQFLEQKVTLTQLRATMRERWSGSWLDDLDLDVWFYRSLLAFAASNQVPVFALEPTPRGRLADRDAVIASTVQKLAADHPDRLIVAIVGQAHLLGMGDLVARTGLPAVTFGGEPTPALRDASPENADRKLLRRSDAGLLWFSELCRRPD